MVNEPLSQPNPNQPENPLYDLFAEIMAQGIAFKDLPEELQVKWGTFASAAFAMCNEPVAPGEELLPRCQTCRMLMRPPDFVGADFTFNNRAMSMIICKHCRSIIAMLEVPEKNVLLNPTKSYR